MKYPRHVKTEKGYRLTDLYNKYRQMKQRCYNKNHKQYGDYGARGIEVETWLFDFDNYVDYLTSLLPERKTIEDMQRLKYSIDRINNDGNYERGNLRWAPPLQQLLNRRKPKTNTSGYQGVCWHKCKKKYVAQIHILGKNTTLGQYNTPEEAFAAYCKAYLKYFGQETYDYMLSQHPHWDANTNNQNKKGKTNE